MAAPSPAPTTITLTRVIEGSAVSERARAWIDASVTELVDERDAVRALGVR